MEKRVKNFDSFFEELNETAFGSNSLLVEMGIIIKPANEDNSVRIDELNAELHRLVTELAYEEVKRSMGESSMDSVFLIAEKINSLKKKYSNYRY